jgi:hypothetical protein
LLLNSESFEKEADSDDTLNICLLITGIFSSVFRPQKTPNENKNSIVHYSTVVLTVLLYCNENWTTEARDARRITATQVKYTRKTAGITWIDYKTNTVDCKGIK